jgi:putative transposase
MKENNNRWGIVIMARVLKVSKSGYYTWYNNDPNVCKTTQLDVLVNAEFLESKARYGYRRICKSLAKKGHNYNKKTIQSSMQRQGLKAKGKRKFRKTTDSKHNLPIYPNVLKRNFFAAKPNEKWVGDITYLWTKTGWTYLATVIDLCTHKVAGWAMSTTIDADLACSALADALIRENFPKGVIMHTDRGSTYCAHSYRKLLADFKCYGSMSRRANCWDNAVAESFFGILKREIDGLDEYLNPQLAYDAIFEFIECWYNPKRLHSTIGYKSPLNYEKELLLLTK